MGQGKYSAIVFGVILKPKTKLSKSIRYGEEPWESIFLSSRQEPVFLRQLRNSYECKDDWLGYFVADDDGNLCTGYDPSAKDPYPTLDTCYYRRAIPLSDILEGDRLRECAQMWTEFQSYMELTYQIAIPNATVLLISDFH